MFFAFLVVVGLERFAANLDLDRDRTTSGIGLQYQELTRVELGISFLLLRSLFGRLIVDFRGLLGCLVFGFHGLLRSLYLWSFYL